MPATLAALNGVVARKMSVQPPNMDTLGHDLPTVDEFTSGILAALNVASNILVQIVDSRPSHLPHPIHYLQDVDFLEQCLDRAVKDIQTEETIGNRELGHRFSSGDETSLDTLQRVYHDVQKVLLQQLADARDSNQFPRRLFSSLASVVNVCRDDTVHELAELRERLWCEPTPLRSSPQPPTTMPALQIPQPRKLSPGTPTTPLFARPMTPPETPEDRLALKSQSQSQYLDFLLDEELEGLEFVDDSPYSSISEDSIGDITIGARFSLFDGAIEDALPPLCECDESSDAEEGWWRPATPDNALPPRRDTPAFDDIYGGRRPSQDAFAEVCSRRPSQDEKTSAWHVIDEDSALPMPHPGAFITPSAIAAISPPSPLAPITSLKPRKGSMDFSWAPPSPAPNCPLPEHPLSATTTSPRTRQASIDMIRTTLLSPTAVNPFTSFPSPPPDYVNQAAEPPRRYTLVARPSSENNYLGFCKGAWRYQNGERKALRDRTMGTGTKRWQAHVCSAPRCTFNTTMTAAERHKVCVDRDGVKLRWSFLAKSHASKREGSPEDSYQCMFCALMGRTLPVFLGVDALVDHLVEHRGEPLGDLLLVSTLCVNDRECSEDDSFDINLTPIEESDATCAWSRAGPKCGARVGVPMWQETIWEK